MSSICSHLIRVSLVSSFITQRASFHQLSSCFRQHDHYQHGIPGIPNDGKVLLLKNSSNGSQVYLVGTIHYYEPTAQTVKKVINYVRPATIALELCETRAKQLLERVSADDNLYTLYLESMRAQGGLSAKVGMFIRNCLHLWRREIIAPNCEFRVAMEEASRLGMGCFLIDQDDDVTTQQLSNLVASDWNPFENERLVEVYEKLEEECFTRSVIQEFNNIIKDVSPESYKVMIEDRDKHMFKELRRFQGNIVAVVGMGHMDGIQLLWKRAEEGDDWHGIELLWKCAEKGDDWQPPADSEMRALYVYYAGLNC